MSTESGTGASRRRGLGRGLSALLGDDVAETPEVTEGAAAGGRGTQPVSIGQLSPNPFQPRRHFDDEAIEELSRSIREKGILSPILVRPDPQAPSRYQIIAGERRWRAAQRAQLHEVPVLVKDLNDVEALEVALVENLQRQDLSILEEADGYKRLMDEFSHTQEDLAKVVGKSRSHIANTLRLLQLPLDVKELLETRQLSAGHARALLGSEDPAGLAYEVVSKGLTVRQTEKLVQDSVGRQAVSRPRKGSGNSAGSGGGEAAKDADTLALERDITNTLGLRVSIDARARGGCISIEYDTLAQLDDILHRLTQGRHGAGVSSMASPDDETDGLEELISLDDLD